MQIETVYCILYTKKSPRADVARGLLLCDKYLDYRLLLLHEDNFAVNDVETADGL